MEIWPQIIIQTETNNISNDFGDIYVSMINTIKLRGYLGGKNQSNSF